MNPHFGRLLTSSLPTCSFTVSLMHMMHIAKQYELFLQHKDQFVAWHAATAAATRRPPCKGGREACVLDTLTGLQGFGVFVKAGGGFAKFEGFPDEASKPPADEESLAASPP